MREEELEIHRRQGENKIIEADLRLKMTFYCSRGKNKNLIRIFCRIQIDF